MVRKARSKVPNLSGASLLKTDTPTMATVRASRRRLSLFIYNSEGAHHAQDRHGHVDRPEGDEGHEHHEGVHLTHIRVS
jgi:hypothetical protein